MPISRKSCRLKRKTRKQRGGSNAGHGPAHTIVARQTQAAARATMREPFGNRFYMPFSETVIMKGFAMLIGERKPHGGRANNNASRAALIRQERRNAMFPYEECVFFLEFNFSDEYPDRAPILYHLTQQIRNYRLHPNLYGNEPFAEGAGTNGKVCLGILGTFGADTWNRNISIWRILEFLLLLLGDNPVTMEPGMEDRDENDPQVILYNRHVMYESMQVTSMIYERVVNALDRDATQERVLFNEEIASNLLYFIKPFRDYLAKRAFGALSFLIRKIYEFIEANDGEGVLDLPTAIVRGVESDRHHHAKRANFITLMNNMKRIRSQIPPGLRRNMLVPANNTHRNLFASSRPRHANGTNMTYNEFYVNQNERALNARVPMAQPPRARYNIIEAPPSEENIMNALGYNILNYSSFAYPASSAAAGSGVGSAAAAAGAEGNYYSTIPYN